MADEERTPVYEYIFCQENEKFTSMFDLPRGTSWISLRSGSYPKLANIFKPQVPKLYRGV